MSSDKNDSVRSSYDLNGDDEDMIESENISTAGDLGDRALNSNRRTDPTVDILDATENGSIVEFNKLTSFPLWTSFNSSIMPLPLPQTPTPTKDKETPRLEYISCLIYLSFFAVLGVLARYLVMKFFGPTVAGVTSENSPIYIGLPCNMVSSFLMGWLGIVFRDEIAGLSDHLAIGLTTGFLGSLSSFSTWNQKMLELFVNGQYVFAFVGFLLGFFLIAYSIRLGIGTAKCLKEVVKERTKYKTGSFGCKFKHRHLVVMAVLLVMLCVLWSVSGKLLKNDFDSEGGSLWMACLVAAPGVWIRWFLARLNGRGLGKTRQLKWVPFGTLIVNVSSATIMGGLSFLQKEVEEKKYHTILIGIKLGFSGCLSTISAFIAEYNAMEESSKNWRAYAYAFTTLLLSFVFGILIYCVPIWTRT
ncbi:fluoride export protein 1-like [Euphorbia lathyris]|uniref:fluoride export protein 1-like n=1 Tax=Euphorbia lathyris TaxID=212925 RepID=UPI003313B370